jgi:hypothetical protein
MTKILFSLPKMQLKGSAKAGATDDFAVHCINYLILKHFYKN